MYPEKICIGRVMHYRSATVILESMPRFPCRCSDKAPLTTHGFYDAVVNADHLSWPLVGVRTGEASGFDALDIDPRHGGHLWLEQHIVQIPPTRVHYTRGGGYHYLFCHAGIPLKKEIAQGVELKGNGGYVIWWPRQGLPFEDRPIAEWPVWLLELSAREIGNGRVNVVPSVPSWHQAISDHHQSAPRWSKEETYGHYAVNNAMHRMMAAPCGKREAALNGESFSLGRLVGAGWLSMACAALAMEHGIKSNPHTNKEGLRFVAEHGVDHVRWEILRALRDGMAKPPPTLGRDHRCP
jgi:Bifunctional DNA primase/polymerase, N-terminal